MVKTIPADAISLYDLKENFGLERSDDEQFFREWQDNLPKLTNGEKQALDEVKADYRYLSRYNMPESIPKIVVLSPLLKLAGFYRAPFQPTAENTVEISMEHEGEICQGHINTLVFQNQLWVTSIETKNAVFSHASAIPIALIFMLMHSDSEKPKFGFLTNGSEFIFLKLTKQGTPRYAMSCAFFLSNKGNLYTVLSILKRLGQLVTHNK
jgi:hypothetical protein